MLNLLDNAIKYNRPQGHITLRLFRTGDEAVLEVIDTGIGIPPESIPRLFERFYRVDKGRAREEGGTGLGLAIVKHVAQTHGGQVEVESRAGSGLDLPGEACRWGGEGGIGAGRVGIGMHLGNSRRGASADQHPGGPHAALPGLCQLAGRQCFVLGGCAVAEEKVLGLLEGMPR